MAFVPGKMLSDTDMFTCCSWGAAAAFPQLQKLDVSSNQLQGSLVKQWVCPASVLLLKSRLFGVQHLAS